MCGIAGILKFDGRPVDVELMRSMVGCLAHRGRDHSAVEWGGAAESGESRRLSRRAEVALGHRRLSVIDLSEQAAQPMASADGHCWLVFNGEIYNYIELRDELRAAGREFRTQSDSEVILQAYQHWGDEFVGRLNGMFAFAIWDDPRQRLLCARDHFGIKPFYIHRAPGHLAFASESKALRGLHGNRLNQDGIGAYLLSLYVPADWSVFAGVAKLPPAHLLVAEPSGAVTVRRFWSLRRVADLPDDAASRTRLGELLEQAVVRQLRSDVPVGALLSAGVDSGMVVAMAARHNTSLHTYSIGFEGHGVNELPAAGEIARARGTTHHTAFVSSADSLRYLDRAIGSLTEPIADPSIVPSYILSEMAAADGVKVLLSGTGGDEIFGGYLRYGPGEGAARRLLSAVPESLRKLVGGLLPAASKTGARLRNADFDMLFSTGGRFELAAALLPGDHERAAFLARLAAAFPRAASAAHMPLLYRQMTFDLAVYLPDEILYLFDQMSMAHTVEGRVPLLDVELVEHAFRFPPASHVRNGRTKVLFREMAEPLLGREHVWRDKHGFTGPVQAWVRGQPQRFLEAAASVRDIPGLGAVAPALPSAAGTQLSSGDCDALFMLYCLRRWYDGVAAG